jgi:hypothetical protein
MINLEYTPSKREEAIYVFLGWCSLGILWRWYYSFFFSRKEYFTRKNLLNYLQTYPISFPIFLPYHKTYQWVFESYYLYFWEDGRISLHDVKTNNCILSSFHCKKGPDAKRYKMIKEILKSVIYNYECVIR